MRNKKSLKNLKQFQNKVRFTFYVVFRPVAQKWFFPVVFLGFIIGVTHYEWTRDKSWIFENVHAEVVPITPSSESDNTSSPVTQSNEPIMAEEESVAGESKSDTNTKKPLATSAIESKILAKIKAVAEEENIDWKVLAAIFLKETQGNCNREGDHQFVKTSIGCYQINKHYHPEVTWVQATDITWSSHWTAQRLKAKAAKFGWDNAIAMHNGNPKLPQVQAYLKDVKRIMETL